MKLKNWSLEHIDEMVKNANNRNVSKNLRNIFPYPYTSLDAKNFIQFCQKYDKSKCLNLAITEDEKAIGGIGITIGNDIYSKSAEIGYWLGEEFWGKGIMTKAIKDMIDIAYSRYGINRIYAVVFLHNVASCRVLEKCGFIFEGTQKKSIYKDGYLYDSQIYALVRC